MQKKSNKLIFAWCIFITLLAAFIVVTKLYFDAQKDQQCIYQCRILIDNDLQELESQKNSDFDDEQSNTQGTKFTENKSDKNEFSDDIFYEHSPYGLLPKIAPNGVRVLDVYAAKYPNIQCKKIYTTVLVNNVSFEEFKKKIKLLGNSKVTFILPPYLNNICEFAKLIKNEKHEFFIQIPTQMSIPDNKKNEVSPFLANASPENLIDKLLYLLASAKYAIGISNITATLLTKSVKDMSIISNELSKRGLAFLNIEKSNFTAPTKSMHPEFLYLNSVLVFSKKMQIPATEFFDNAMFLVHINELHAFLDQISKHKDYVLSPVSVLMRKK